MNANTLHPLTKEQSDFAAKNYEMVFTFLSDRKLDADEFHDAVIMSYLAAVQTYDECSELRRKPFEEVAIGCMAKAVARHLAKQNLRRTAETLHAYGVECDKPSNLLFCNRENKAARYRVCA